MNHDKLVERDRYDRRAREALAQGATAGDECDGARGVRRILRSPYLAYEAALRGLLHADSSVLEIGAGSGNFTGVLLSTGARVTAADISPSSLQLLSGRFRDAAGLTTSVADMEFLPFASGSFDLVAMAGSLSYGDNDRVLRELYRVLRSGGTLVCVDSLNHNPIYRFNRWVHYRFGERSRSTLQRMPTLGLLEQYQAAFGEAQIRYFGALSWLTPVVARVLGELPASNISDGFDRLVGAKRSAFKFVLVARKLRDGPLQL